MKKNLLILTGIALLIAALAAGGCKPKPPEPVQAGGVQNFTADPTNPKIYLKDTMMADSSIHLFMYDKSPECGVIDDHLIVVKRNHTVKWRNAPDSRITEILHILPVGDTAWWRAVPEVDYEDVDSTEVFSVNEGAFKLEIPDSATPDTIIKYEIMFIADGDTTTIDPYLRIPPEVQ